jgi:hypothetical protein
MERGIVMTGYCEDCKHKQNCEKSIGFMVGFCNTDFEPVNGPRTRAIHVLFSDGDTLDTEIYATEADALDYYRPGKMFNLGVDTDRLVRVVSAELID